MGAGWKLIIVVPELVDLPQLSPEITNINLNCSRSGGRNIKNIAMISSWSLFGCSARTSNGERGDGLAKKDEGDMQLSTIIAGRMVCLKHLAALCT